jgi:redox-sensitive bicupin YhaK (pirin superfamily)
MESIIHKADQRGAADLGWLKTRYSFSFADWYNPERMGFAALRVLNDDWIAPGKGFGMHPHRDMEIITLQLEGALEHRDSLGNHGVIQENELQVMSAGSGVLHSEFNPDTEQPSRLLQIWIHPREQRVKPRYQKIWLAGANGSVQPLVGPDPETSPAWIHQDAWLDLVHGDAGETLTASPRGTSGLWYLFVIEGSGLVNGLKLETRDAVGLMDVTQIEMSFENPGRFLLFELPA